MVVAGHPALKTPQQGKLPDVRRAAGGLEWATPIMRLIAATGQEIRRPPPLPIDGAVLCDYDGLDPAGRWCDCNRPLCPHAAYLVDLFPTVATARRFARARAELFAELNLPSHGERLVRSHRIYVRWLHSDEIRGHDYRVGGCRIADAAEQLRDGRGGEPAWREIKRQQLEEGADGALLASSRTPYGQLFIYASSLELLQLSEVKEELIYPFG